MVVARDGRMSGTIGGGALEWEALGAARAALSKGGPAYATRSFALGPELGQCCGGRVRMTVELLGPGSLAAAEEFAAREAAGPFLTLGRETPDGFARRAAEPWEAGRLPPGAALAALPGGALLERFGEEATPVLLFGAGHVGRAVVLALAPVPFRVGWIDPRPDAFPERMPGNVTPRRLDDPASALDEAPEGAFVLVMTHSHALDLEVATRALRIGRAPYVGLIGSATKRARFRARLEAFGLGEAARARLVCPIGLPAIRSKLPAAIAAGVAADLLVRREALRLVPKLEVEEAADA